MVEWYRMIMMMISIKHSVGLWTDKPMSIYYYLGCLLMGRLRSGQWGCASRGNLRYCLAKLPAAQPLRPSSHCDPPATHV